MGLRLDPNLNSLGAQRQVAQSTNRQIRGLQALASGQRINRAADDAAGLAIAEALRSDVRQLDAESANLQTGINVAETADAALSVQQEGLGRLQELAVQAGNGTLTDDQRAAINGEAQQILQQIGEVAENTEFNGQQLLNTNTQVPIGTEDGQQITINESTPNALGINGLDLSTQGGAESALSALQTAQDQVSENRSSLGAQSNGFQSAITQRENASQNSQEAESRIRDLDVARASILQARNQAQTQLSVFAVAQGRIVPETAARLLGG